MNKVLEHYEYLHTIPELGFNEIKTSSYLAEKLKQLGFVVTEKINNTTGVIGIFDSGKAGVNLGLRADMDALGHVIDGVHCAKHTCGHDAHCSIVLATAEHLIKTNAIKQGRLKIIFQPAEELGTGAQAMIKGGAIDDLDMLIGLHLRPIQECQKGSAVAAMYYSASATLKVTVTGAPSHGARPHLGVNALDAAVCAINAVNTIKLNPELSYSVKATKLICDAGVTNAIPDLATVYWDLRSQHNQTMIDLKQKVFTAIEFGAKSVGAKVQMEFLNDIPAAEICDEVSNIIAESIVDVLGEQGLKEKGLTPGGEDFWFYAKHKPALKTGFMGLGVNLTPGLHHPDMQFDLDALNDGVKILSSCATKILG